MLREGRGAVKVSPFGVPTLGGFLLNARFSIARLKAVLQTFAVNRRLRRLLSQVDREEFCSHTFSQL